MEHLAKLGATIVSLRGVIDKFGINDDSIHNQVNALQFKIDDYSVLVSGSRLEHLEHTFANCVQDFQQLVYESDELHQMQFGIPLLKQIQHRLKRFHNRSQVSSTTEMSVDMCDRCSREILRIEQLRVEYRKRSVLELAAVKDLMSRASASDESEDIPQLHARVLNIRLVANAIDDQEALGEINDLCRKSTLLMENRDNWLNSKVLVSLSEAESVFRNHRSNVADLIAAIDKLKQNDHIVAKVMNSALQVAITSKIEKTANELKRSLVMIQDDQRDKKAMLDALNLDLKSAIDLFNDGRSDHASFATMLELQSSGMHLKLRIHIEAGESFKEFDRLSSFVSEIHVRRERLSSLILEANYLRKAFELWFSKNTTLQDCDAKDLSLQPLLLQLHRGSQVIASLRIYESKDTCGLDDQLQSLIFDALVIALDKTKEFLSNSRRDIAALDNFLAANNFAPAVPIVDSLKESIGYHQIILLHIKHCYKTLFKFYRIKVCPHLIETRLLEFDLVKLIHQFDQSALELPMLRDGVLAQGESILNEAHLACMARNSVLAREKLSLAILLLQKVCDPQRWQAISDNLILLERRCCAEAAAATSLCKMSKVQSKVHNYNAALTLLISACAIVEHWNLSRSTVMSSFEHIVSSALVLLSEVCRVSNEIWDRFDRMVTQGLSSCQGQNLISAGLDIVQHQNLVRDVVCQTMFGDESVVWDNELQVEKKIWANQWNSTSLHMSPFLTELTKELNIILEKVETRNQFIAQRSEEVLTALGSSIKASLLDNASLAASRVKMCDAIRERRLTDATSAARETLISVVNAGVSPDFIKSTYAEYGSMIDCMTQLESVEPSFSIPYHGISLPHVGWLPPKTVKLDTKTTRTIVAAIFDDLNSCLEVCCCALAQKEIEDLELHAIVSLQNRNNMGFLYSAAALAPGAFFEVLLARHSCQLDAFQTLDGLTLLHFACCYCNYETLKVILENLKNPDVLFLTDCHGRNALHFLFCGNRESIGLTESAMFSIFDSIFSHWVSLQDCISKVSPESQGIAFQGGFRNLSRKSPRSTQSHQDLDTVFEILKQFMCEHLEKFIAPDHALNNFMHYIACRRIRGHRAAKPQQNDAKSRRSGLVGSLHSNTVLLRDNYADLVVDQEKEQRDLITLYKIFQLFQKPLFSALLNTENLDGMSPLLLASSHGNSTVVALFVLQLGADTACCDLLHRTPLHFAADRNDRLSMQLFLRCQGIDACAIDHRKQTALFRLSCLGYDSLFTELATYLNASGSGADQVEQSLHQKIV